jgi:hypothetical protein
MNAENRLLSVARKMDKGALAEIFDFYGLHLYNYALRCCNDPCLGRRLKENLRAAEIFF